MNLNTAFYFMESFFYFTVYFLISSLEVLSFDHFQFPNLPTLNYLPYLPNSYLFFKTSKIVYFISPNIFWMTGVWWILMGSSLRENLLLHSQQLTISNHPTTSGGTVCVTPLSMLAFRSILGLKRFCHNHCEFICVQRMSSCNHPPALVLTLSHPDC